MKTIKVFLASSEELEYERLKLNQAIQELNKNIYNKKDVNIDLFMWEMHDRQCRTEAKQAEYNQHVRGCDMFLGLFWTKAGRFTLEEFDVAHKQYNDTQKAPALYVFFKEVEPDKEEVTLKEFKDKLLNNLTHYASNFCSVEKVKYEFLEEFLRLEVDGAFGALKIAGTNIMYDDYEVCNISALPCAFNNKERVALVESIEKIKRRIKKLESIAENDEDWADIREEKAQLEVAKKELTTKDEALLGMSIDFARRASSESSAKLSEAREAFRLGNMKRVRELTNLSEIDIRIKAKQEYDKALNEDFELLLISRNATMESSSIPIKQRITEVDEIYLRLLLLLKELHKEDSICAELIFDYAQFSYKYAHYGKAKDLYLEHIELYESLFGADSSEIATSYNNIGLVYNSQGDYPKALEYYHKALAIFEKVLGTEHPDTASSYNNIAITYYMLNDMDNSLMYFKKCADTKIALGLNNEDCALSCAYVAYVSSELNERMEYHQKALAIRLEVLGEEHLDTAQSYFDVGNVYIDLNDYKKAIENTTIALTIRVKLLGEESEDVADCYNNIGYIYNEMGEYSKAMENHQKALAIKEKVFGEEDVQTSYSYHHIGKTYRLMGDYPKALPYLEKALAIRERELGAEDNKTNETRSLLKDVKSKL